MWAYYLITLIGLGVLFATSSYVVNYCLAAVPKDLPNDKHQIVKDKDIYVGKVVGRCENILIYIFILANEVTGIALVFTAKTLVRKADIEKNPDFFLIGSMVNFTYSVVVALAFNFLRLQVK